MWQCHISVAFIKALVNFFRDCVRIQKSILTGGSFAGHYRTDLCPCSTCYQAFFRYKFLKFFNLIVGNSRDFHRKSGGIQNLTAAKFFCCICHTAMLCCSYFSICRENSCRKQIGSSVIQKAHSFYSFFIFRADC